MKPQGVILRRVLSASTAMLRQTAPTRPAQQSPSTTTSSGAPSFPWRLTRRLNSTGTLTLYRASASTDRGPGCYVLKTFRIPPRPGHIERALLLRESTVCEVVKHPNLISVLAAHQSPRPHVLLPYQEGASLRCLLTRHLSAEQLPVPRLPVARALNIARQIAEALAAMHAAGWLHGQVRPQHIILSPQGHVTLIDLTMARRLESRECDPADAFPISAHYAAPEMSLPNHRLTAAADTYSLGIVLYESLAGQPPFTGSSPQQLLARHRTEAPPDIRQLRPDISLEVAHLLRLILAKEPLRRPNDSDLLRWLTELEIAELSVG